MAQAFDLVLNVLYFIFIARIVVSWVAPRSGHPAVRMIYDITEPILAPIRQILPPMSGLDLSPIIVFLAIGMLQRAF